MNLTLEIVSANGASLGPARRKVFGPEGGRIGRSPDCDWVLANPYVSRHHATIRWISGTYYIESTGENGVAIGMPQAMIPKLERRPLRAGDHVFIDEYEAVVGLDSVVGLDGLVGEPSAPAASPGGFGGAFAPADDPFAALGPAPGGAAAGAGALLDPLEPAEELDPLKHLGGGPSPVIASPRQEPGWNHTPGVNDQFSPPPAAPPASAASVIPDDWDRTTFGRARTGQPGAPAAPPAAPAAAPSQAASPPPAAIPDDWDKTSFSRRPAAPAAVAPAASTPAAAPTRLTSGPEPARAAASAAIAPSTAPGRAPTPGPSAARAAAQPAAGFDVAALFAAAGVDPASVPPETAGALGQILRSVVQGVIEVLRARAEIKEQFRLSQTIVKTTENNPLKFAVNAEDALGSLLGRRVPGYLPPVEAFEDAFDDIRFHQLAMLAGMRAAFDHVLSRFDPRQMQESFEKRTRRGGLLPMGARSRYWEQFVEEFQELAADRERAFRRLFAEEFATAYEQQLGELKRAHAKARR